MGDYRAIARAVFYLQLVSIWNALRLRLRRLRQPKYAFGALIGAAYIYFFFIRNALRGSSRLPFEGIDTTAYLDAVASVVLLLIMLGSWIVPSKRAALQFTEAEVAFLFPAPVTRRMLIHYRLLRAQTGILFTSLVLVLLFRRGAAFGGSQLLHGIGWWLILSTLNLHLIGASFAREQMLGLGLTTWRRRALIVLLLGAIGLACWWWLRTRMPMPSEDEVKTLPALLGYAARVLAMPPLSWMLAPFHWLVAPFFAHDGIAFLRALGPALALLIAHYVWVVRSDVSFEEASIDAARRRSEQLVAMRSGRMRLGNAAIKARSAPFRLAPEGFAPLAFLWKNLIAMGPFYRFRTWAIACVLVILGTSWVASDPVRLPLLQVLGMFSLAVGVWIVIAGPMFMQREVRQTLGQLDILKSYPLRGWQIVLGELLTPMTVMAFAQWLLLLTAALCFGYQQGKLSAGVQMISVGAPAIALIAAPMSGLMLCIPFAGLLYFPAWMEGSGRIGGGVEAIGQRMMFVGGFLVVLVVSLLPAALFGFLAWLMLRAFLGMNWALWLAAVVVSAVLVLEFAAAVDWLGRRLERFDFSQELDKMHRE